jgi:hypothetical protein
MGVAQVHRNNIKNVTFYVMSSNDEAGKEAGEYLVVGFESAYCAHISL